MNSKHIFIAIAALPILLSHRAAFSQHPNPTKQSGDVIEIKDGMHDLKQSYTELDRVTGKRPLDYEAILKILDKMHGSVRMIQKMNGDPDLEQPFNTLLKDVQTFQKVAKKKDPSQVENSLNGLYENCFRCHLTHASPRQMIETK